MIDVNDCIEYMQNLKANSLRNKAVQILILSILEQANNPSIIPKVQQLLEDISVEIAETEKIALENETDKVVVKLETLSKIRSEIEDILIVTGGRT